MHFNKYNNFFLNWPTAISSLSLGIIGLGNLYIYVFDFLQVIPLLLASVAFVLIVITFLKYILHPALLINDMKNHVISATLPTMGMTLMAVSHMLLPYFYYLSYYLWIFAISWHLFVLIGFIYYRIKFFNVNHTLPSWFVPPVGIAMSAVTAHPLANYNFLNLILIFAITTYLLLLPLMQYRLLLGRRILSANRPTIAILAAPPNLCLAGYLSLQSQPQEWLVFILLGIGLLMTLSIYFSLFTILKAKFTPSFSALTFPAVISATALNLVAEFLKEYDYSILMINIISAISYLEFLMATMMVAYVSYGYMVYFKYGKNTKLVRIS